MEEKGEERKDERGKKWREKRKGENGRREGTKGKLMQRGRWRQRGRMEEKEEREEMNGEKGKR